jgi:toxin ParE1/3/4
VRVRWTEAAAAHVEDIYDFIARDNPDAVSAIVEKLIAAVERLTAYPNLGRAAEHGARKLIHPPFVIVYRVVEDVINVESVFHGSYWRSS